MHSEKPKSRAATRAVSVIVASVLIALAPLPAKALNPDSPEVKQTVEKALRWLEKQEDSNEDRLGGKCLIGLSFVKAGRLSHPKVAAARTACEMAANSDIK